MDGHFFQTRVSVQRCLCWSVVHQDDDVLVLCKGT